MKQIRVHGPNDVRLDDVPPATPGSRDALVRMAACGICGSDISFVHMGGITGKPMALGHEMAGVVEWVGSEVSDVRSGDRVVIHPGNDELGRLGSGAPEGGLTPMLLVREAARGRRLFQIPDAMPLRVAALTEPLAVGIQAVRQADIEPGDTVAVFGCGPIGLMSLVTLADMGRRRRRCHRSESGAPRAGPGVRCCPRARPNVGGRVGRTGPPARHRLIHAGTDPRDRRLH